MRVRVALILAVLGTDATGHVTLPIDRDGAWLVRTVHMIAGAQARVSGVEWDSYWATLAFPHGALM